MRAIPRQYLPPLLAGGLFLAAIVAWAHHEVERDQSLALHELRQASDAIRKALHGTMLAEVRGGWARRDRLDAIFANIVASSDLLAIRLTANGSTLAQAGKADLLPKTVNEQGEHLLGGTLVSWETLALGDCPVPDHGAGRMFHGGRGMDEYDLDLRAAAQVLTIARDAGSLQVRERQARRRGWTMVGAGTLATLALMAAWIASVRGQLLQRRLEAAESRALQMEELELAAMGLAHETKHPLGIIRGLAQQIYQQPMNDAQRRDRAEQIMEEADVAVNRMGDFMQYARIRAPKLQALDLVAVTRRAVELLRADAESQGTRLIVEEDATIGALADPEMLTQVILNLLRNSLQACADGDEIAVRFDRDADGLRWSIRDTGSGIPAELLPRICKPYVTGRTNGHGIGLAIVQRIAEAHDWKLAFDSQEGQGTTVTLSHIRPAEPDS